MKKIILGLLLITSLQAELIIEQNIKALYQGIELSTEETNYILENKEKNIQAIQTTSQNYTNKIKNINDKEKNVIEFTLTKEQTIKDLNFLKKSNKTELNDLTKEIISNTKFTKTANDIKMRFIFVYDFVDKKNLCLAKVQHTQATEQKVKQNDNSNDQVMTNGLEIPKGTTSFVHNTKEYIRTFETNGDGFIHVTMEPALCATLQVLTSQNERVLASAMPWSIHGKISKGKYKLLVKTRQDCDVNMEYP